MKLNDSGYPTVYHYNRHTDKTNTYIQSVIIKK